MIPETPPFLARITLSTVADYQAEWCWYADGTPVDLTGCHARFELRVVPTDLAPLFAVTDVSSSLGLITLGTLAGGNAGLVALAVSHLAIVGVVAPVAHGQLLITMSTGVVVEFAEVFARLEQGSTY